MVEKTNRPVIKWSKTGDGKHLIKVYFPGAEYPRVHSGTMAYLNKLIRERYK